MTVDLVIIFKHNLVTSPNFADRLTVIVVLSFTDSSETGLAVRSLVDLGSLDNVSDSTPVTGLTDGVLADTDIYLTVTD